VEPGVALFSQQFAADVFIGSLVFAIEYYVPRFGAGADEEFHLSLPMPFTWLRASGKKRKPCPGRQFSSKPTTDLKESTNNKTAKNRSGTRIR
jgi:hypothetical protein